MLTHPAYARPETLYEALLFLKTHGIDTRPLAGGTDVMVDLRAGKLKSEYLLDISRLKELQGIGLSKDGLSIGAGVTISEIYNSPLVAKNAPSLIKSCAFFGSPQIRNVATIGGNVGNASPSADTVPPLLVHEARAVLASENGERTVALANLFEGPYRSGIRPDELLIRFILEPADGRFTDFQKIGRRKALAISRMSMALLADPKEDGTLGTVRLALGSGTPTPMRMEAVEAFLKGKRADRQTVEAGSRLMAEEMVRITGRRPSTEYKEKAVQGLFLRILAPLVE
ncbi:FAD binding domain in molybdopterin dehydrogenase [delta proteobacterium NaphS2]|nr:FAD binding domain in molybdopterin dehydrogenase [delta proteobacterium NaphS2]